MSPLRRFSTLEDRQTLISRNPRQIEYEQDQTHQGYHPIYRTELLSPRLDSVSSSTGYQQVAALPSDRLVEMLPDPGSHPGLPSSILIFLVYRPVLRGPRSYRIVVPNLLHINKTVGWLQRPLLRSL